VQELADDELAGEDADRPVSVAGSATILSAGAAM